MGIFEREDKGDLSKNLSTTLEKNDAGAVFFRSHLLNAEVAKISSDDLQSKKIASTTATTLI